jgi:hypothetical protein
MRSLLRDIHHGEFDAADYDDAVVQDAIKRGYVEPDYDQDERGHHTMSLSLTTLGRYEAGLIECECAKPTCAECEWSRP